MVTRMSPVTRGTVQCDRLQSRSPGSVRQNPAEAQAGGESSTEPMRLLVLGRGFSLGTPGQHEPAVPGLQHLLFQRHTIDRELFHCCLPDSHLSDHFLHFRALALKQQLNPAQKKKYPQFMSHKQSWVRAWSSTSPQGAGADKAPAAGTLDVVWGNRDNCPATSRAFSREE